MSVILDRTIDDDTIAVLASALGVAAEDMLLAAQLSSELPAAASVAELGARLLVGVGAVSTGRASTEEIVRLSGMTFQLEHGELARANWIGHREAGRPSKDSFADQLSHVLARCADDESNAKLTMSWGSAGYGEFEMETERVSFLYSTQPLFKQPIMPGVMRLNAIEVDWARKFVVEMNALARYARSLHDFT
ncbi:hypothetical protein LRP30_40730 [Bradyrhizobium sp. C-145]|uniref:hypothetical protein n=1 Tax=Bradyrhizobium sp. C-145 TaxID=574727 RepID=UPI00201B7CF5|nr:hypothetical protein [Bradyrhizobium sp. C-145]UQR62995.1 hypothetical protein LRP30_40730 [Bradyrhizobium sp. C-145]